MRWFDAHNHLQDPRLGNDPLEWVSAAAARGIAGMVVHGTCEGDWPEVRRLADLCPSVIPAFGLHPWRVSARSPRWCDALIECLDSAPHAVLGEVGLDRWILDQSLERCVELGTGPRGPAPLEFQLEVLDQQLVLASERGLPVTVHCLQAWGPLMDCLRGRPRLPRGFLLHSYGGSVELVPELVRLGAHFSISGHSLHPLPPADWVSHPATDTRGRPVNSPVNLVRIAEGVSGLLGVPIEELAAHCEANWMRFFRPPFLGETGLRVTAPAGSAGVAEAVLPSDRGGSCLGRRSERSLGPDASQ